MIRRPPVLSGLIAVPEPPSDIDHETAAALAVRVDHAARVRLGRSLAIHHLNTGSCNGCELELRALTNPVYELHRFGLRFVENPGHADVLLITGPLTRNLTVALDQAWDAIPDPKWVVAVGDCAVDGGVFKGSYAVLGGPSVSVPIDLTISGCPPTPERILTGLRTLLEVQTGA